MKAASSGILYYSLLEGFYKKINARRNEQYIHNKDFKITYYKYCIYCDKAMPCHGWKDNKVCSGCLSQVERL